MYTRHTALSEAFIRATAKLADEGKVDHARGRGPWVARHVAENVINRNGFGMVTDYDHCPPKPVKLAPARLIDAEEGHFD